MIEPFVILVPVYNEWRIASRLLRQLDEVGARFLLLGKTQTRGRGPFRNLARSLFDSAPCHTLMLRVRQARLGPLERIVVPTSGGPHAPRPCAWPRSWRCCPEPRPAWP